MIEGSKFVKDTNGPHGSIEYSEHIRPVCLPCVVTDPSGDQMLNAGLCDSRRNIFFNYFQCVFLFLSTNFSRLVLN